MKYTIKVRKILRVVLLGTALVFILTNQPVPALLSGTTAGIV